MLTKDGIFQQSTYRKEPRFRVNIESRPGTQDAHAFREVIVQNGYRLPTYLSGLVIDIGAHIGCFSVACLLRGVKSLWAFEPDLSNFHLLEKNLQHHVGAHTLNAAVWRSDRHEPLTFSGYPGGFNACGTCLPGAVLEGGYQEMRPVETIGLDAVIDAATGNGSLRRVRLLKIDAEGAEFPALGTCTKLGLVDEICGECHEFGPELALSLPDLPWFHKFTMDELAEFLKKQGFSVEAAVNPHSPRLHLFWAKRKGEQ